MLYPSESQITINNEKVNPINNLNTDKSYFVLLLLIVKNIQDLGFIHKILSK